MPHDTDLVALGTFVRERRSELGLTQTELGDRLGWAQERVSVLEHGKYGLPSLPQLCRLADALHTELDELVRRLGVTVHTGPATAPDAPTARHRLAVQLGLAFDRMQVVEQRLHDAEDQVAKAQALRESIREERDRMRSLLTACQEP